MNIVGNDNSVSASEWRKKQEKQQMEEKKKAERQANQSSYYSYSTMETFSPHSNIEYALAYLQYTMLKRKFTSEEIVAVLTDVKEYCYNELKSKERSTVLWHLPSGIVYNSFKKHGLSIEELGFIHIRVPLNTFERTSASREYGVYPRDVKKDEAFWGWYASSHGNI